MKKNYRTATNAATMLARDVREIGSRVCFSLTYTTSVRHSETVK